MILIQELKNKWSHEVASFDAPLHKGLRIDLDSKAIKVVDPQVKLPDQVFCILVDWRVQIKDAERGVLTLFVKETTPPVPAKEEKPPFLDRIFATEESRFFGGIIFSIVVSLAVLAFGWTIYRNAEFGWELVGRNIRWIGWMALGCFFFFILPSRLGLNRGNSFKSYFFRAALNLLGLILIAAWLRLTLLPEPFKDSPQYFVDYAHTLTEKFSSSYWPVLLSILPWAAVAFKLLGFEFAEKAVDAVKEAAKPDK